MRKAKLVIAAAAILISGTAMADDDYYYEGNLGHRGGLNFNGPVTVTPVATLKGTQFGERPAVIEGNILRQIQHDKFLFSDGTAEIVVEIDDDVRLNQKINSSTRLRMFGEYEAWDGEMEVDWVEII